MLYRQNSLAVSGSLQQHGCRSDRLELVLVRPRLWFVAVGFRRGIVVVMVVVVAVFSMPSFVGVVYYVVVHPLPPMPVLFASVLLLAAGSSRCSIVAEGLALTFHHLQEALGRLGVLFLAGGKELACLVVPPGRGDGGQRHRQARPARPHLCFRRLFSIPRHWDR